MSINKKKIILYIGLYKSGSTFIQSHFHKVDFDDYRVFNSSTEILKLLNKYLNNHNTEIKEKILNIIHIVIIINWLKKFFTELKKM